MSGLYVFRTLTGDNLYNWAKQNHVPNLIDLKDMHVTQLYSKAPVAQTNWLPNEIVVHDPVMSLGVFGENQEILIVRFRCWELEERHAFFKTLGASHDFDHYRPHITLSYDISNFDWTKLHLPQMQLSFDCEVFRPLNENWKAPGN